MNKKVKTVKIKCTQWVQLQKQLRQRIQKAHQYESMYWKEVKAHSDTQSQLIDVLKKLNNNGKS